MLCITIIGIPFGVAAFRIGVYALWPFGRTVVDRRDAGGGSLVGNVLWVDPRRLVARARPHLHGHRPVRHDHRHPPGIANFKLIPVSLMPLGKEIVPTDQAFAQTRW